MANAEPSVFVNTTLAGVERVREEKVFMFKRYEIYIYI